jgi:hypothetical protein
MGSIIIGIVTSVLTTGVSIWVGVALTKVQAKRDRSARGQSVKSQLLAALRFNKERADQAAQQIAAGGKPNFPYATTALNGLIVDAHGFASDELLRNIAWTSYQMEHVDAKLMVVNVSFLSTVVSGSAGAASLGPYMADLQKHHGIISAGISALILEIEAAGGWDGCG